MQNILEEEFSMISGPTPRGLRGWGFFDSICDMTLLIRPPIFLIRQKTIRLTFLERGDFAISFSAMN